VIENSTAYAAVRGWASVALKRGISSVFANEVQLASARRVQENQRRLAELPEHKRQFAQQQVHRIVSRHYGEKEERVDAAVGVLFDALEYDEYWSVVRAIDLARHEDVRTFAAALDQFGLVDMAVMGAQARRRLEVLDRLDYLLLNPDTKEAEMHRALEHNLWVLGADYSMLSSNRSLRSMVEGWAGGVSDDRAAKRPDLLLATDVTRRYVLIEFKRPSLFITRDHEAQAIAYRDDLRQRYDGITILLIGAGRAKGADTTFADPRLTVTSYAAIVSKARAELEWLLDQLGVPVNGEQPVNQA
jgi:hypothetical protein